MIGISDKQAEMLAFIKKFAALHGYPPTYEEIKNGLKISSKSLVNYHLAALENAQLLSRVPNTPRGIQLKQEQQATQLALADPVGATFDTSWPTLSQLDVLELTVNCVETSNLLVLQVGQNAHADDSLGHGDIIILQGRTQAQNGDLVAIRMLQQHRSSLKRYYRENGHVRLQSPNAAIADMIVNPTEVEIQGKVVAVIRQNG
jgi:repressor LexA